MSEISRLDQYRYVLSHMKQESKDTLGRLAAEFRAQGINLYDFNSVFRHAPFSDDFLRVTECLFHSRERISGREDRWSDIIAQYIALELDTEARCCGTGAAYLARQDDALVYLCSFCGAVEDREGQISRPVQPPQLASRQYLIERFGAESEAGWAQLNFPAT